MTLPQISTQPHEPAISLEEESVAGEEDPGAALDVPREKPRAQPSGTSFDQQAVKQPGPGDEAPAGTTGTGESICRECGGTGLTGETKCANCGGTGKVIVGLGGG
jgi:DnaJ-class molecular chaperone